MHLSNSDCTISRVGSFDCIENNHVPEKKVETSWTNNLTIDDGSTQKISLLLRLTMCSHEFKRIENEDNAAVMQMIPTPIEPLVKPLKRIKTGNEEEEQK